MKGTLWSSQNSSEVLSALGGYNFLLLNVNFYHVLEANRQNFLPQHVLNSPISVPASSVHSQPGTGAQPSNGDYPIQPAFGIPPDSQSAGSDRSHDSAHITNDEQEAQPSLASPRLRNEASR